MEKRILSTEHVTNDNKISRDAIRGTNIVRGIETWKIPIENLVVKADWNDRIDFGDIDELAEGILANGGTDPIYVDIMKGTLDAVITDGERRYMAYLKLIKDGHTHEWLKWMYAFNNSREMNTVDRMVKKLTTNNGKHFEAYEEAMAYKKLMDEGLSQADIAKRVGKNRMHVSNRIVLSTITAIEKDFVESKLISVTEWVKLAKKETDLVKRVNLLVVAAEIGEEITDIEKFIAEYGNKKGVKTDDERFAQDKAPDPNAPVIVDDIQGIENGEYTPKPGDNLPTSNASALTEEKPKEPVDPRQENGLAALLKNSSIAPAEDPDMKPKKKGFTASELISDEVGKTLGDQEPETGTVKETLKEVAVLIKALDRIIKSDSKMSDLTFKMDKKIRYLQGIANKSMLGALSGETVKEEATATF
jgi:ParB-like chromosome segregation protein Spo0J